MTSLPPLLRVEDLRREYGAGGATAVALRGVSFEVGEGEFVALRGPSGCGKSTLLHILGGMDRPTSGRVWLGEVDLGTRSETALAELRRSRLGFVFQFFNLLPTLTALENVALPLLLGGVSRAAANDRAMELLERVGLAARARHSPSELSGGEMQRVAVARALAPSPRVVLADEPTGSLDSDAGRRVLDLLSELWRELGVTFVIATHSDEVSAIATREIRLRDGLIEDASA